jgi:TolA-binding protein
LRAQDPAPSQQTKVERVLRPVQAESVKGEAPVARAAKPKRMRTTVAQGSSQVLLAREPARVDVEAAEPEAMPDDLVEQPPEAPATQALNTVSRDAVDKRAHDSQIALERQAPVLRSTQTGPHVAPLDEEVMQMRSAYDHLRAGDALRALSALSEHARRFPQGKLAVMREAVRVQALCELGRVQEARAKATRFLAAHGSTPYAARVGAMCAPTVSERKP